MSKYKFKELFKRIEREDPLFEELVDAHARMISFGFAGILSTIFGAIGVFSPQPVGIALEIISVAGICVTASVIAIVKAKKDLNKIGKKLDEEAEGQHDKAENRKSKRKNK